MRRKAALLPYILLTTLLCFPASTARASQIGWDAIEDFFHNVFGPGKKRHHHGFEMRILSTDNSGPTTVDEQKPGCEGGGGEELYPLIDPEDFDCQGGQGAFKMGCHNFGQHSCPNGIRLAHGGLDGCNGDFTRDVEKPCRGSDRPEPVPEPDTLLLFSLGAGGLATIGFRARRRQARESAGSV